MPVPGMTEYDIKTPAIGPSCKICTCIHVKQPGNLVAKACTVIVYPTVITKIISWIKCLGHSPKCGQGSSFRKIEPFLRFQGKGVKILVTHGRNPA